MSAARSPSTTPATAGAVAYHEPVSIAGRRNASDFETVVHQLHRDVWLLCRHLGDPDAADDLTQDTFLRAHKAWPRFRGDSSPRTWLFAIARRVCADHVRRAGHERDLVTKFRLERSRTPTECSDPAEQYSLWQLVAALPQDRRAAFVLTQILGLSYDETAAACECPVGTVRSRVARARDALIAAQHGEQTPRTQTSRRKS